MDEAWQRCILTKELDKKGDAIKGNPTTIAVEVVQQPPEEIPTEPGMLQHNNMLILNRRYSFENFVVGAGNRLAFAASNAVAGNPGNVYNPLYIYGGVGLGKTHLLQGIAHYILAQGPASRCREGAACIRTRSTNSSRILDFPFFDEWRTVPAVRS